MSTTLVRDSAVLMRRSLRHIARSPDTVLTTAITPVALLLLFVHVLGGAIDVGRGAYVDHLLPGIMVITIASGVGYTAFRLYTDVSGGIFERFQTLPLARFDLGGLADCAPDDPRLPVLVDRVIAFLVADGQHGEGAEEGPQLSADLVELLDRAFVEACPCAGRLLELLEARGWTGWTDIRRRDPAADAVT